MKVTVKVRASAIATARLPPAVAVAAARAVAAVAAALVPAAKATKLRGTGAAIVVLSKNRRKFLLLVMGPCSTR